MTTLWTSLDCVCGCFAFACLLVLCLVVVSLVVDAGCIDYFGCGLGLLIAGSLFAMFVCSLIVCFYEFLFGCYWLALLFIWFDAFGLCFCLIGDFVLLIVGLNGFLFDLSLGFYWLFCLCCWCSGVDCCWYFAIVLLLGHVCCLFIACLLINSCIWILLTTFV